MKKYTNAFWCIFVLSIVAFPVLGIIQFFSRGEITPYTDYVEFIGPIYGFLKSHFGWFVVAILSYMVVVRKLEVKYRIQEIIRKRQYYFEYERWRDTPYIPPILYFYMMSPPTSFSPYDVKDHADNDFYPKLVRDFQSRVSMHANFCAEEPTKRVSVLRVIGFKIISNWFIHLGVLAAIIYFVAPGLSIIEVFTKTNAKFLIPVILHIIAYNTMVVIAVVQTASWKLLDNKLMKYFNERYLHHEPRIPWVDLLPDTDAGYGIEQMWVRDCFRRIQVTYEIKGWTFPHNTEQIKWVNTSIPSNPFPDNFDMSWVPKAREHVQAVKQRWQHESENKKYKAIQKTKGKTKGQVVAFNNKKKYF